MKRKSLIAVILFGIIGTFSALAFAQPPALEAPALFVSSSAPELDSFMRFGGFQTELDELEKAGNSECTCENCTCGAKTASVATKMVTRYRSVRRATGRMVQQCFGGTCRMVPEMTTVSEPYQVEVPVAEAVGIPAEAVGIPEVATYTTLSVMSDVCPDCGQVHGTLTASDVASGAELLRTASGRQRLFQPVLRWRQRLSSGRWFPNAWWNR